MNQWKNQWMEHATALIPTMMKVEEGQVTMTWDLPKWTPYLAFGLALADGPLPVLDAIATYLLVEYLS